MERLITNLDTNLGPVIRDQLNDNFKKLQTGVDGQSDAVNKQIKDMLGDVPLQDQNEVTQARIDANGKSYDTLKGREDATQATAETALSEERDTSVEVQNARTNSISQTYPTLKERMDTQESNLNNSINNKLATMRLTPEAFANEAALRAKYPQGNDQLNVTTDNGHLWIWMDGDFKDCGQFQTVGIDQTLVDQIASIEFRAFLSADEVVAPFDSFDTLPANSLCFYVPDITNKFANVPFVNTHVGMIIQTAGKVMSAGNTGCVQNLIDQSTGDTFYRYGWRGYNGQPVWSDWRNQKGLRFVNLTGEQDVPYNDLDTMPVNTLAFSGPTETIKNVPVTNAFVVKTEGPESNMKANYGKVQTLIDQSSGAQYHRSIWVIGNGLGDWTSWRTSNENTQMVVSEDKITQAPYDDLDTLPVNTVAFYVPADNIKHSPTKEAMVVETSGPSFTSGSNYGKLQTLTIQSSGAQYHRSIWVYGDGSGSWGQWHYEGLSEMPSLSIFDKVTVIGDSYSAGWLQKPDGSTFYDRSKYQWSRLIGKKYSFNVNNLSMSGWTAKDFVTNKMDDITKASPQDAYIIALGINDQSNGTEVLGTKDDLKQNYQDNPDSFYGNMGKIIGTIKANDPNARIILLTIMRNDGTITATFNSAIRDIAGYYNLPVAELDSDPYFKTNDYIQRRAGGHPTIVGYAALAQHLEYVLQKTILDNESYFDNTASIFDNTVNQLS